MKWLSGFTQNFFGGLAAGVILASVAGAIGGIHSGWTDPGFECSPRAFILLAHAD